MQIRVVRDQEIANRTGAIAQDGGRIFSGGKGDLVVKQENPVFEAGDDRLDQYRIVMLRNRQEVPLERRFAVNDLGKIAARSLQRLEERARVQFPEIGEGVFALMPRGTMRTMPLMQEEIFAPQRRDTRIFKDPICKIFVGCERGGGGIILRIPRTSSGAEMKAAGS